MGTTTFPSEREARGPQNGCELCLHCWVLWRFCLCFYSWSILLPFSYPLRLLHWVVTISNRWEFENIGKSIEGKPVLLVELNRETLLAPGFAWKHGISLNLTRIQADCLRHASVPCLFRWSVEWSWKVKWWKGRYNCPIYIVVDL